MKELFSIINQKPEPITILISLIAALAFSVILYLAYRLANTKESYQPQFAITLVTMALISTVLMDLIQSNLALSLGMLGSLSIVRFRTNIKDTRDIGFIFWSMAIGLAAATQSYFIGAAGSLILACVMISTKKRAAKQASMLMVIRGSHTDLDKMQELVKERTESVKIRAKNILAESFEIVYEVQLHEEKGNQIIEEIFCMGGIDSVNLLAQNN